MQHVSGWKPAYISYTRNLVEEVRTLDPVAGREKEIAQVCNILSRRTKNSPLVIGEPGVGKTAIVEGLAQQIALKNVPVNLQNKVILQLDISALTAGARQKGEFEQRLKDLLSGISSSQEAILFIDDLSVLVNKKSGNSNAAILLKKYIDRGLISVIGTITDSEYKKLVDSNKAFERDFQTVRVEEPSDEEALAMLQAQRQKFEKYHGVTLPDEVLTYAISLTKKHIPARLLPDKAFDVIDEAAAEVKLHNMKGLRKNARVRKADIEKIVADWMGINITQLNDDESKKLLMLEKLIHKQFAGQNTAVTKVSDAVRRGRIGLGLSNKPLSSFLFIGGSGIGKTELVKVLTRILFEKDNAMLQLDMSEYMDKSDISKLIGAPPGFNGYEEGGILTEAVSKRPSTVVLLDNIEKMHPEIGNILLQMLDEGHVTDNKGNKVSFKNTIIFGTTNIGAGNTDEVTGDMKNEILKFLSPELLNRFDEIVSFKPLTGEDMEEITRLLITQTAKLLKKQDFTLQVTTGVVKELAKFGTPTEGARPLRKIITETIENPVAVAILEKKFKNGDTILVEFISNKGFVVSSSSAQILANTQIKLPKLKDIAAYDKAHMTKQDKEVQEVDSIYLLLKKLSQLNTVTDPAEKAKLEEIQRQLADEKQKGNPVADVILTAIQSFSTQGPMKLPLPKVNGIQVISDEDFEEVKKMWIENYLDMDSTGNSLEAQLEWVKKEDEATTNMIKLFTSETPQDKDEALKNLVHILPMLLIGGFTQEEVVSYLKAKSEAAKSAEASLTEEIETTVSVKTPPLKPQQKTMQAQV